MKKFLTALLCLAMAAAAVFGLAACKTDPGTEGHNPTLTLNKTTLSLEVGESETLEATASEEGAIVTWSSSDSSVASVSGGTVTAVAAGNATITARAGDASATCAVTVTSSDPGPVVTENPWSMPGVTAASFNEDFTEIYPSCASFGQGVVLNRSLAEQITGPYKFSFTLDATAFEAGTEAWMSILGSWNEETGNCLRTGIHFMNGAMNTVSAYGPCNANSNLNFTNIVEAAKYPQYFPDISAEPFRVDFVLGYDEDENIVAALYFDDVLIWFLNYTEYCGGAFTFTDAEYVGFDFFNTVQYEFVISDVSLTNFEDPNYVIPDLIPLEERAKQDAAQELEDAVKAASWQNAGTVSATASDETNGTEIAFSAQSAGFGTCVIRNVSLAALATAPFEFSFTVDASNIGTAETWLGILPAWSTDKNALRMGLHWNQGGVGLTNFASYGPVGGAEDGFSTVVAPGDVDGLASDCMSTFAVKVQVRTENESVQAFLYIGDALVMTYDLGAKYAEGFDYSSIAAIGFDYVGAAGGIVLSDLSFRLL